MHFIIDCKDKPGHLDVRMNNRDAHLAFLGAYKDRMVLGGPTLDDDGNMNGSLLVLELNSKAEVEAFVENDPYTKAGLFETVDIRPFKKVLPST